MQMDTQISQNVEQVTVLGNKVDAMKSATATLMAMMTSMMGKKDALLAQQTCNSTDDRRVRPRPNLEGAPSGLE